MLLKLLNTVLTVVAGIGAALILFWVLNKIAELLPEKWEKRVKPYFFILPAMIAIIAYLVYPTILTINDSFKGKFGKDYVGAKNYVSLFSSNDFRNTLLNTILWVIVVPIVCIAIGLLIAVFVDRLRPRAEKTAKTVIFLPMAISAVSAATVWRFVYAYKPPGSEQIGLLNATVTATGADPVPWLTIADWHLNSFLLMVMMLWAQIGFAMVLLSAAVKAVPIDTIEAARLDGASEPAIFRRVIVPQIWPTIVTVFVTVTITVMKTFDVVYAMTGGQFNTSVIGVQFFRELFTNNDRGAASAIVVILMIAIIPIMIYQVRQFRREEEAR